ncbi:MAG: rRNA adenine dimethyltransferase family protein, partial [Ilumatobacter sp.]
LLDDVPAIASMLVMVQKEVADRMAAGPGSKLYGAVSVKVAYWASALVVATVPASVFVPRPNVESALVRIDRRAPPPIDPDLLFPLVRQGFGQRRKMLRKSLRGTVSTEQFATAGVAPDARPEDLGLDAWCRLARTLDGPGAAP